MARRLLDLACTYRVLPSQRIVAAGQLDFAEHRQGSPFAHPVTGTLSQLQRAIRLTTSLAELRHRLMSSGQP
jgi:hypothetical protein